MPPNPEEGSGLLLSQTPPLVLETSRTMVSDTIYPKVSATARLKCCGFNQYLFSASRWSRLHYCTLVSTLWTLLSAKLTVAYLMMAIIANYLYPLNLHTLVSLGGTNYCILTMVLLLNQRECSYSLSTPIASHSFLFSMDAMIKDLDYLSVRIMRSSLL